MDTQQILLRIIYFNNLLILVIGTIFNGLTLIVCLSKELRKTPTFVFFAFNAFIETVPLWARSFDIFLNSYFNNSIRKHDDFLCTITLLIHFFPLQSSAWLLVAMSVERYLSIRIKMWTKGYFNAKRATLVSCIVIALFFGANFYSVFSPKRILIPASVISNITIYQYFCDDGPLSVQYSIFSLYAYSIVPFVVLAVFNALLIYEVKFKVTKNINRSEKDKTKRTALANSVIAVTLLYIIMTAPSAIIGGYFIVDIFKLPYGTVILNLTGVIRFYKHAINFFVLMLTNKKFNAVFKEKFHLNCGKKNEQTTKTTLQAKTS